MAGIEDIINPARKPAFFAYCRASTTRQENTIKSQAISLAHYWKASLSDQYEWGKVFADDGVSGFKKTLFERPAGRELYATLLPGDCVGFTKVDRAFRSTVDAPKTLAILKQRGVRVVCLDVNLDTGSAMGEFMSTLLAAMGQLESQRTGERVMDSFNHMRMTGYLAGRDPPPGYYKIPIDRMRAQPGVRLKQKFFCKADEYERNLITALVEAFLQGTSSTAIDAKLTEMNYRRRNGAKADSRWMPWAMHCAVLGWPLNFPKNKWREYRKSLSEIGIKPDENNCLSRPSLRHCQALVANGVDLSVPRRGCPHIPALVYPADT